jgi:hypothetical protein
LPAAASEIADDRAVRLGSAEPLPRWSSGEAVMATFQDHG